MSRAAPLHEDGKRRCAWCTRAPLYVEYHDREWGVPQHDERRLFEMLCLEGAQAGLSWLTVLQRRADYRRAFDDFDAEKMARYGPRDAARLLRDAGIIRNRLKIESFIANARAYLQVRAQHGSFDRYIWQFTGGRVLRRRPRYPSEVRSRSALSDAMSRDLKGRGFRFVGTTICYAYMQAVGMLDEHERNCWVSHPTAG